MSNKNLEFYDDFSRYLKSTLTCAQAIKLARYFIFMKLSMCVIHFGAASSSDMISNYILPASPEIQKLIFDFTLLHKLIL